MSWIFTQHPFGPSTDRPINVDEMRVLIAWKRANKSWTAIEADGLEPERVLFAQWLVQSGRVGEGQR